MSEPHFSDATFEFLDELTLNNRKEWFEANKARYESVVRGPALELIRAMAPRLESLSDHFVASDRKSGGSLMRIYRDMRFSKEKVPYKTNIGIQFRHVAGKDVHAPGFYVHVDADECFVGVGMWRPDSPSLKKIRAYIDENEELWRTVIDDPELRAVYRYGGDSLKRPPQGYDADHPMIDELKRKDHILVADIERDVTCQSDFPDVLRQYFETASTFTKRLCEAVDLPF